MDKIKVEDKEILDKIVVNAILTSSEYTRGGISKDQYEKKVDKYVVLLSHNLCTESEARNLLDSIERIAQLSTKDSTNKEN